MIPSVSDPTALLPLKPIVFDENFTGIVGSDLERKRERYPINRAEGWLTI